MLKNKVLFYPKFFDLLDAENEKPASSEMRRDLNAFDNGFCETMPAFAGMIPNLLPFRQRVYGTAVRQMPLRQPPTAADQLEAALAQVAHSLFPGSPTPTLAGAVRHW